LNLVAAEPQWTGRQDRPPYGTPRHAGDDFCGRRMLRPDKPSDRLLAGDGTFYAAKASTRHHMTAAYSYIFVSSPQRKVLNRVQGPSS